MSDTNFLEIGAIIKAHGIRGEVVVDYYAESPDLLHGNVFLQKGRKPPESFTVLQKRNHQGRILLLFKGIEDRTAAETLRGYKILIPKDRLPHIDSTDVYLHELMGLRVVLHDTDKELGSIVAVDTSSGQELWGIATVDGYEILLPAVPEFVRKIDPTNGIVRISPPEGLLELYMQDINAPQGNDQ